MEDSNVNFEDFPIQGRVLFMLGQLDGKLTAVISKLDKTLEDQEEHEGRIRTLEQKQYWLMGVSAAVGAIAGFMSHFIPHVGK